MKLLSTIALPAVLLMSAALNIFQMQQIRQGGATEGLQPGQAAAPVTVSTLEGQRVELYIGKGQPTLLYVFSPRCGWCTRNRDNMVELEAQLRDRYRFAGISLSERGLEEYLTENPLPFKVYKNPSAETLLGYAMGGTPQTILISSDGKIQRVWSGAYAGETAKEIEQTLGVRLPGLTDD